MSQDNSKPFWKSIRGVGRPGTDRPLWETVELKSVPYKEYDDLEVKPADNLPVSVPTCQRCGLKADHAWHLPNTWWCHFCWEEVKAPMNPNAMIPKKAVPESGLLEPTLSDPRGTMICPKCASSRRPRADNQGFECLCVGETWHPEGVRRASPTNGF